MTCDNCEKKVPETSIYEFKTKSITYLKSDRIYMEVAIKPTYCIDCIRDALSELRSKKC